MGRLRRRRATRVNCTPERAKKGDESLNDNQVSLPENLAAFGVLCCYATIVEFSGVFYHVELVGNWLSGWYDATVGIHLRFTLTLQ